MDFLNVINIYCIRKRMNDCLDLWHRGVEGPYQSIVDINCSYKCIKKIAILLNV